MAKSTNFDGKPSLHPERKGQLNKSPKKNWVDKAGGLPTYINSIATAIIRDKGWTRERAIRTAVNWAKKACTTGKAMGGRVSVSKAVQAAACAAVRQWESKKGKARTDLTSSTDKLTDEAFYALFDMDWNAYLEDDENQEVFDFVAQLHEEGKIELSDDKAAAHIQLPVENSESSRLGRKLWRKEILPIGKSIKYQGETLDFSEDFADELIDTFNKGAFEDVPLVLADAENRHTEDPERNRGRVLGLEKTDNGVAALIETDKRGSEILENNPTMGVSPRIFTNYVRGNDETPFGTVLRHVAITQDPQVYGLNGWEGVDLSADHADDTTSLIDLSAAEYITRGGDTVEKDEKVTQEKETPAVEEGAKTDQIDLAGMQGKYQEAIDLANRALREKNEMADKLHTQEVERRLSDLSTGENAVPKALIDLARPLVLRRESEVIDLTNSEGNEVKSDVSTEVFKLLEAAKVIPMGEQGTVDLTNQPADDDAALEALRQQFGTS